MASAVDPRFKMKYVAEENRESIEARLTSEMKTVMVILLLITIIIIIIIYHYYFSSSSNYCIKNTYLTLLNVI